MHQLTLKPDNTDKYLLLISIVKSVHYSILLTIRDSFNIR